MNARQHSILHTSRMTNANDKIHDDKIPQVKTLGTKQKAHNVESICQRHFLLELYT